MTEGVVHIVDDEAAVRASIAWLLRSAGVPSRQYPSAHDFLADYRPDVGCLVLDVRMPHMTGLELHQELNRRGWSLPVIFVTGHGDIPLAVEAMREGAFDFLLKPFKDDDLIARVRRALSHGEQRRRNTHDRTAYSRRMRTLTRREREVLQHLVTGHSNKVIAMDLGLSDRTVENHRARVMQKLGVRGVAQLVQAWRIAEPGTNPQPDGGDGLDPRQAEDIRQRTE